MDEILATRILDMQSKSRVASFREKCANDRSSLKAYEWSLTLGQALLKPIGITEIAVRNALDRELCAWWKAQGYNGTWLEADSPESSVPLLAPFVHAREWRKRAHSNKHGDREMTHDDVIAHTSLGTWRNMIGNPASLSFEAPPGRRQRDSWLTAKKQDALCAELWKLATRNSFPHIPETKRLRMGLSPRAYIGARLTRISGLRNRVCHWDNLLTENIPTRYDDMKRVVSAIDEDLGNWLCGQCDEEMFSLIEEGRSQGLVSEIPAQQALHQPQMHNQVSPSRKGDPA